MSFLAPLGFAFAAALPVVIAFYLLKRRRTTRLVSSTLLWQKFLAETQANAPFQKLRHNWLLILQLLLLALVVLALARPFLGGTAKPTQLKVLILDASASMQAIDEKPSRFEKARADALKLVDGLRDGERMMILLAGANTEVKQSATSDKAALRRALEACAASDAPTRITEALKMAAAFTFEKQGENTVASGEIHLLSDGALGSLGEFENKNLPLIFHRVGQRAENLGITHLDVRANPDNAAQRAVFATVANFSSNTLSSELELRFEGEVVEVRSLKLGPKEKSALVFVV
ncbi:MAG TPA: BatA and WFA domain-containing protein, partial [Verrucomicrobiae bacterium]